MIVTTEPKNVQAVLATKCKHSPGMIHYNLACGVVHHDLRCGVVL